MRLRMSQKDIDNMSCGQLGAKGVLGNFWYAGGAGFLTKSKKDTAPPSLMSLFNLVAQLCVQILCI